MGILAPGGAYFYYAHLDSYADLKEGDPVKAGDFLGYMGDSGYGEEGTTGKFPVHLHVGIYLNRRRAGNQYQSLSGVVLSERSICEFCETSVFNNWRNTRIHDILSG